ncbi:hypothetical protein GpartN1_g6312.t1 [Galdieria partita]|uniref:RING-type E3 ubiquitin transferase n=1 Tax=Galdieria partita TaxID=83374 RepID=A0A9C7Q2Z2_9RHOD|nr:hypothetical protein GpartN1_g6312.t1 [Galdieria partita]
MEADHQEQFTERRVFKPFFCYSCQHTVHIQVPETEDSTYEPQCSECGSSFVEEVPISRLESVQENVSPTTGNEWYGTNGNVEVISLSDDGEPVRFSFRLGGDVGNFVGSSSEDQLGEQGQESESYPTSNRAIGIADFLQSFFVPRGNMTRFQAPPPAPPLPVWRTPRESDSQFGEESTENHEQSQELTSNQEEDQRRVRRRRIPPFVAAGPFFLDGNSSDVPGDFSTFMQQILGIYGNPADYVIGEQGFEAILARLMQEDSNRYGNPPASKEIVASLPVVHLSAEEAAHHSECSVCKEAFAENSEVVRLPCKHVFCKDCIYPWLERHNTCPSCRYELPTDDPEYEKRKVSQSSSTHG